MTEWNVVRNSAMVKKCHFMNLQGKNLNFKGSAKSNMTAPKYTWQILPKFLDVLSEYPSALNIDKGC
jgi:hypothetical protein